MAGQIVLTIMILLSVALLFAAMVLSAMASADAAKKTTDGNNNCHKYSMWSAIITGVSSALILIGFIITIISYRKEIAQHVGEQTKQLSDQLATVTKQLGEYAQQSGAAFQAMTQTYATQ